MAIERGPTINNAVEMTSFIFLGFLFLLSTWVPSSNGQSCRLSGIPIQKNFNVSKVTGNWFGDRVYPYAKNEEHKLDLAVNIAIIEGKEAGKRVLKFTYHERKDDEQPCGQLSDLRKESKPGIYYHDTKDKFIHTRVVYTDYKNFMVEFVCYKVLGIVCTKPEVVFWSRRQTARDADVSKGQEYVRDLCVSTDRFYNVEHSDDGCVEEGGGPGNTGSRVVSVYSLGIILVLQASRVLLAG